MGKGSDWCPVQLCLHTIQWLLWTGVFQATAAHLSVLHNLAQLKMFSGVAAKTGTGDSMHSTAARGQRGVCILHHLH